MKVICRLIIVCVCCAGSSGCVIPTPWGIGYGWNRDVTNKVNYHKGYGLGEVYVLNQESTLRPGSISLLPRRHLTMWPSASSMDFGFIKLRNRKSDPWFIEFLDQYERKTGVVDEGTRFEIVSFKKVVSKLPGEKRGYIIYPFGRLLDGPYAGTEFEVEKLSRTMYVGENFNHEPDPEFVARVKE